MHTEAQARILIDGLLRRAGWRFFDGKRGLANVSLKMQIKIKNKSRFP